MNTASCAIDTALAPAWRQVDEPADLVQIFDPEVQVCSWRREFDPAITAYLATPVQAGTLQTIASLHAGDRPRLPDLPAGSGREALIDDIAMLGDMLRDLLDCAAAGLRLARVKHAMCPGWHMDRTGIRLVCTYQGPGTEWLDDQGVDRRSSRLERLKDDTFIQAAPGEVVLLKGVLWQGNDGLGAVHRSPEITDDAGPRTLVTLDPLWEA